MNDALLTEYNRQLASLNQLTRRFSQAHPRVANQLGLTYHQHDPSLAHLYQAMALMSARIELDLNNGNEQLAHYLLNLIDPAALRLYPLCSIVQFHPKKAGCFILPARTELACELDGTKLRFTTGYATQLVPFAIHACEYRHNRHPNENDAAATLSLQFHAVHDNSAAPTLTEPLSLFISAEEQYRHAIFEAVMNHCTSLSLSEKNGPTTLITAQVQPRGYHAHESLLPQSCGVNHANPLRDYFYCADKFLFISVDLSEVGTLPKNDFTLTFTLNKAHSALTQAIDKRAFSLNCTPVINLYPTQTDPIRLKSAEHHYPLQINAYAPASQHTIHTVTRTTLSSANGDRYSAYPYLGLTHYDQAESPCYWIHHPADSPELPATIELVENSIPNHAQCVLMADVLATNGTLPAALTAGNRDFYFWDGDFDNICTVTLIQRFHKHAQTEPSREPWRLVSHLALGTVPLHDQSSLCQWIKETIHLNATPGHPHAHLIPTAIVDARHRVVSLRTQQHGHSGFCQGSEITITLDEQRCELAECYLFFQTLFHSLSTKAAINQFIQLRICNTNNQELALWSPVLNQ